MADPYVYPDTNVLINKLNIKNQDRLDQYEALMFKLAFENLRQHPLNVINATDILNIHKLLFSEVYEWAGNIRTINVAKQEAVLNGLSVNYYDKKLILNELSKLNNKMTILKKDSLFIKKISRLISKMWQIHPFREGNTRAVVVFLYLYLKNFNLNINFDLLEKHSKYFRNALVLASIGEYSEYQHLELILNDAIFGITTNLPLNEDKSKKYKTIKNLDLSTYKYNYHTKK